ncbi:MAG: cytochrome C assembly protein [Acidobacteria bacterium]|jgi:heme exporter protein C|nr:MAG: cytochrome C assembly protein [Acidobacteriota bacterium]
MRDKVFYLLAAASAALLSWNLYKIFFVLGDEKDQGSIWRIFHFHVPSNILGMSGFIIGMVFSLIYLVNKNLRYDAIAAAITEVSLVFAAVGLVTGSIWARIIWGVWWAWDARLTSMLVCWLIFAGYLMLRRAIEEPIQRARLSAVVSVFGGIDVFIVWKSIEWWRTLHPGPVLTIRNGGGMPPGWQATMYWNLLALLCLAVMLVMVRMRQEGVAREIDSLRRMAHSY